jgi:hypothetical protein
VSGLVTLTALATDNVEVTGVSFWVNNYRVVNATPQADGT